MKMKISCLGGFGKCVYGQLVLENVYKCYSQKIKLKDESVYVYVER